MHSYYFTNLFSKFILILFAFKFFIQSIIMHHKTAANEPQWQYENYIIALPIPLVLQEKIATAQQLLYSLCGIEKKIRLQPYIALVTCTQIVLAEKKIATYMRMNVSSVKPFEVALQNFSSYPTHSIFIPTLEKEGYRNILQPIKKMQRVLTIDDTKKPHFLQQHPIIIGSHLTPIQYETAWPQMAMQNFSGKFVATHLYFLKKNSNQHVIASIPLLGKNLNPEQTLLF
jgi:hypothetical protein